MSAINDFLIKSAGMEKEANKVFQKLLKRGIKPRDLDDMTLDYIKLIPPNRRAAFRDLTTPLKDRTSASYRVAPAYADGGHELRQAYDNYLKRVVRNSKDPRIVDFLKHKRKSNALSRFTPPVEAGASSVLLPVVFSPELIALSAPSVLRKYKVRTPYATTHHMAEPNRSLQANTRALETPNDVNYIENPDPDYGWKKWRSTHFRVNRPGQRWTEDEMNQMLTSNNLSGTPLYETVFTKGTKEFPTPIATYVADTPEIRKALDIPESAKSIPITDIQDPAMDFVYKGMHTPSGISTSTGILQGLSYGLRDTLPARYRNGNAMEAVLSKWRDDLGMRSADDDTLSPHRWFAPAAKTSAGYIDAADKNFIRLDADTLARYRKLVSSNQDTFNAAVRNLFGEMSESQLSDLIRAAIRDNRINKLQRAYMSRAAATGLQKPVRDVLSYAADRGF